jgi:hypothetical protein
MVNLKLFMVSLNLSPLFHVLLDFLVHLFILILTYFLTLSFILAKLWPTLPLSASYSSSDFSAFSCACLAALGVSPPAVAPP